MRSPGWSEQDYVPALSLATIAVRWPAIADPTASGFRRQLGNTCRDVRRPTAVRVCLPSLVGGRIVPGRGAGNRDSYLRHYVERPKLTSRDVAFASSFLFAV